MLNDLRLRRVDIESLPQRVLSRGVLLETFQDPANLLQGKELVLDCVAVDEARLLDHSQPLRDGRSGLAIILEKTAEIYIGRQEVALQPQTLPQDIHGSVAVARLVEDNAVIEIGGVQQQVVSSGRTSSNAWCLEECSRDPAVAKLTERISGMVGLGGSPSDPGSACVSFDVLRFADTQPQVPMEFR